MLEGPLVVPSASASDASSVCPSLSDADAYDFQSFAPEGPKVLDSDLAFGHMSLESLSSSVVAPGGWGPGLGNRDRMFDPNFDTFDERNGFHVKIQNKISISENKMKNPPTQARHLQGQLRQTLPMGRVPRSKTLRTVLLGSALIRKLRKCMKLKM